MTHNIGQFNAFTAKLLGTLYDAFPIPIEIRTADVIVAPDVQAWLRRIGDATRAVRDSDDPFARAEIGSQTATSMSADLKNHDRLKGIFSGTMKFLIEEGFIRASGENSSPDVFRACQLTGKGLVHLNKKFADKQIADEGMSIIAWLKTRFSNASSIEGAVAAQMLGGVIGRFLIP